MSGHLRSFYFDKKIYITLMLLTYLIFWNIWEMCTSSPSFYWFLITTLLLFWQSPTQIWMKRVKRKCYFSTKCMSNKKYMNLLNKISSLQKWQPTKHAISEDCQNIRCIIMWPPVWKCILFSYRVATVFDRSIDSQDKILVYTRMEPFCDIYAL